MPMLALDPHAHRGGLCHSTHEPALTRRHKVVEIRWLLSSSPSHPFILACCMFTPQGWTLQDGGHSSLADDVAMGLNTHVDMVHSTSLMKAKVCNPLSCLRWGSAAVLPSQARQGRVAWPEAGRVRGAPWERNNRPGILGSPSSLHRGTRTKATQTKDADAETIPAVSAAVRQLDSTGRHASQGCVALSAPQRGQGLSGIRVEGRETACCCPP